VRERKRTNKQKRQDNGKEKTQRNKRFEVEKKEESESPKCFLLLFLADDDRCN
jgi:hypothetical protein